jgi:UDP-N-acetylmuramoylalanine--D-glutamate ligase
MANDLIAEGIHNVQNALAVIAAAKLMGVPSETIARALAEFKGIKHRIERVGEIDGVACIDDSKGTNVDATLKAVGCMKGETVLLLGGKNKGYDYHRLFSALKDTPVVHAVLYGENRYSLLKSARETGFESITVCQDFDFAVAVGLQKAKRGQTLLLSPASASFDEFSGYEERGNRFVEIVRSKQKQEEQTPEYESEQSKNKSAQEELENEQSCGANNGHANACANAEFNERNGLENEINASERFFENSVETE